MKKASPKPKGGKPDAKKTPKPPRKLNIRQERFAELVVSGMPATRAYVEAGYSKDPRIAEANACRLMENDGIRARIAELRKPITRKAMLSKDRKRELLREIAESPQWKLQDRLRALEIDAKLAGHFEPDRVEVEAGPKTLLSIKERSAQVASALARRYEQKPG